MIARRRPDVWFEDEIAAVVGLDTGLIDVVERAFCRASEVAAVMPPVHQLLVPDFGGQTCVKSAWTSGDDHFAVKLSSIYPPLPGAAFAEANGLMAVIEASSGRVQSVLLDNGRLTELRTAAAGAVAARHLACPDASTLAILGAGKQAVLQARAIALVRPIRQVIVWARRADRARDAAAQIARWTTAETSVAPSAAAACATAEIIATTTTARSPVLADAPPRSGKLIIAMGSDSPGKRELGNQVLRAADLYVADSIRQCVRLGELQQLDPASLARTAELSAIIAGTSPGRCNPDDLIVADLTGLGIQDSAIAVLADARLRAEGQPAKVKGGN